MAYRLNIMIEMEIPTDEEAKKVANHIWTDVEQPIIEALDSEDIRAVRSEVTVSKVLRLRKEG